MIALMLASSQNDIAYILSLAGPGVDGKTILLDQSEHIARFCPNKTSVLLKTVFMKRVIPTPKP